MPGYFSPWETTAAHVDCLVDRRGFELMAIEACRLCRRHKLGTHLASRNDDGLTKSAAEGLIAARTAVMTAARTAVVTVGCCHT